MAKNNKTRFFYVLYSDKTRVFDQSKRAYYPIYVINEFKPPVLSSVLSMRTCHNTGKWKNILLLMTM